MAAVTLRLSPSERAAVAREVIRPALDRRLSMGAPGEVGPMARLMQLTTDWHVDDVAPAVAALRACERRDPDGVAPRRQRDLARRLETLTAAARARAARLDHAPVPPAYV